jgi:tetratricopeptide (TPR) repeat protein
MYEMDDGFESLRRIALWNERFGNFDEALAMIDQAINIADDWASDRDVASLYADLAAMFYAHGFVDEAIDNIDRSLELVPGVVPRIALRADMLRVRGMTAESDKIFESLPNLSPHPFYKTLLARVLTRRGEEAGADSLVAVALDEYDRLTLKYFSVIARRYVEFLLEFNIDPAKALKIAYGQSRKRRDLYSYELLAWAYYKNQKYDLAWSSIGLALRRKATDPRVVYRASVIAKAAGRPDKHRVFTERTREMNPLAEEIYGP